MDDRDKQARQLRELLDKQAIQEVLWTYCRAVDRHDHETLLTEVYGEGAIDLHGPVNGPIAEIVARDEEASEFTYLSSHHHVSNVLIEFGADGDLAQVESYLTAVQRRETPAGPVDDHLKCRYLDRFERRHAGWRIAKRTVVHDWGASAPATERAWWDDEPGEYVFGSADAEDPLYRDSTFAPD